MLVGDDPASHTYVRGKRRDAEEVGMVSFHHPVPASASQEQIEALIDQLAEGPEEPLDIVEVEAGRGLVKDKERPGLLCPRHVGGQLEPLRFPAGERG